MSKSDKRSQYTINAVKDSFLSLIKTEPYAQISIAKICRHAEISRSTFYLHFKSIQEVLNEVVDDALNSLNIDFSSSLSGEKALLPACQRLNNSPKYSYLLSDTDLTDYIIGRIIRKEQDTAIPTIMQNTGLNSTDARTLFLYNLYGSFAINRLNHFKNDEKWNYDTHLLDDFVLAGYRFLQDKNNKKS